MKPYLLASLIMNAVLTVILVWGGFLFAVVGRESTESAQALDICDARLHAAHTSIDVGERYFQVCLTELEEAARLADLAQRRLARCQGIH